MASTGSGPADQVLSVPSGKRYVTHKMDAVSTSVYTYLLTSSLPVLGTSAGALLPCLMVVDGKKP